MKFLVFQHVPHEHPGLITKFAAEKGIGLVIIELWKSYTLPKPEEFDGLIIMGGPMGVYEDYPSKNDEVNFIKQALGKMPILGLCLGSQLLAYALGAKVYQNEKDGKRLKEIGYYDVELAPAGLKDSIFKGFTSPIKVLQWHGDTFDLPNGATLLASGPDCKNQAFKYGNNVYALQFHVEFTPEMIEKQLQTDKDWIHDNFNLDEDLVKRQAKEYAGLMEDSCKKLFDNFVSV